MNDRVNESRNKYSDESAKQFCAVLCLPKSREHGLLPEQATLPLLPHGSSGACEGVGFLTPHSVYLEC